MVTFVEYSTLPQPTRYIKRQFISTEVNSLYSQLAITIPPTMSLTKGFDWEKCLQHREIEGHEWKPYKQEIKSLYLDKGCSQQ